MQKSGVPLLVVCAGLVCCAPVGSAQMLTVDNPSVYNVEVSDTNKPLDLSIVCPSGRNLRFFGVLGSSLAVAPGRTSLLRTNNQETAQVYLDVELSLLSEKCIAKQHFMLPDGNTAKLTFTYTTALINLPVTFYFYSPSGNFSLQPQQLVVDNPSSWNVSLSTPASPLELFIICPSGRNLYFYGAQDNYLEIRSGRTIMLKTDEDATAQVYLDVDLSLLSETCSAKKEFETPDGDLTTITFTYVTALVNLPTRLKFYNPVTQEKGVKNLHAEDPDYIAVYNPSQLYFSLNNLPRIQFQCPSGKAIPFWLYNRFFPVRITPGITYFKEASAPAQILAHYPQTDVVERCVAYYIQSGIPNVQLEFFLYAKKRGYATSKSFVSDDQDVEITPSLTAAIVNSSISLTVLGYLPYSTSTRNFLNVTLSCLGTLSKNALAPYAKICPGLTDIQEVSCDSEYNLSLYAKDVVNPGRCRASVTSDETPLLFEARIVDVEQPGDRCFLIPDCTTE
jgi:hypothetical protein